MPTFNEVVLVLASSYSVFVWTSTFLMVCDNFRNKCLKRKDVWFFVFAPITVAILILIPVFSFTLWLFGLRKDYR